MAWANIVSEPLWPAASGAALEPGIDWPVLWFIPGMLLPELAEQPARAMAAARAAAEIVRILFMENRVL
jgi:hypothetical protein